MKTFFCNVSFIWIEFNSFPRNGSGGSYSPVFVPYLQKSMRFLSEFVNLMLNFCGFTRSSCYFKSIGPWAHHSIISFAVERFHPFRPSLVYKYEAETDRIQDHTSQDHFCSLIDEFLTRNLDSDPPRWRVETTGSQRETVAEWTRSTLIPFRDIEDLSVCLSTCRGASRVLSGRYQFQSVQ